VKRVVCGVRRLTKDLARSVQQFSSLKDDKRELLAALTDLIESPQFQSQQHPELVGLIQKVCTTPS